MKTGIGSVGEQRDPDDIAPGRVVGAEKDIEDVGHMTDRVPVPVPDPRVWQVGGDARQSGTNRSDCLVLSCRKSTTAK